MSEQLALEQRPGNRGAVDGDKRTGRPRALPVQRPREQLFPRPAFADDHHGRVAQRGAIDQTHHIPHRLRLGQDPEWFIAVVRSS